MKLSEFIEQTCKDIPTKKSREQERLHAALGTLFNHRRDFKAIPLREYAKPPLRKIGCLP